MRLFAVGLSHRTAPLALLERVAVPADRRRDVLAAVRAAGFSEAVLLVTCSRTEIYAAEAMVVDAARRRDDGHKVTTEASCCKLFASEMCGRVADRAVQILGGAGYVSEYGIERYYRDVRLFRLYEGTTQIQQLIIARNMIREAAG